MLYSLKKRRICKNFDLLKHFFRIWKVRTNSETKLEVQVWKENEIQFIWNESLIFLISKGHIKYKTGLVFIHIVSKLFFLISDQCEWTSPNQQQNCWNCITKSPFSVWGKIFAKMDYTQAYTGYQNTMAGYNSAYHSAYQYATPNHLKVSQIVFTIFSFVCSKNIFLPIKLFTYYRLFIFRKSLFFTALLDNLNKDSTWQSCCLE